LSASSSPLPLPHFRRMHTGVQYAAMHLLTSNRGKSFPKALGVACTFEVTTVTLSCCFLKPWRPGRLEGGPLRLFTASRALRTAVNSRGGQDTEKNSRGHDASRETIEAWGTCMVKRALVCCCSMRGEAGEREVSIEGTSTLGHEE
jgi:hypothetical protein